MANNAQLPSVPSSHRTVGCQTELVNNGSTNLPVEMDVKKAEATLALNLSLFCQWQWYALYLMGQARVESIRHGTRSTRQRRSPRPPKDRNFEGAFCLESKVASETAEATVDNIWRRLTTGVRSTEQYPKRGSGADKDSGTKKQESSTNDTRANSQLLLGALVDSVRAPLPSASIDVSPQEDFSSDASSVFHRTTKKPSKLSRMFLRYARRCELWASGKGSKIPEVDSFWLDVKRGWDDGSLVSAGSGSESEAASTPVSDSTSLSDLSDLESFVGGRSQVPDLPRHSANTGFSEGGPSLVPLDCMEDTRVDSVAAASRRVEASHRAEMLSVGEIEGIHRFMLRRWRRAAKRKRRDYSRDRRDASAPHGSSKEGDGRTSRGEDPQLAYDRHMYVGGHTVDEGCRSSTSPLTLSSTENRTATPQRRRRKELSSVATTEKVVLYEETCASSSSTRRGVNCQSRSRLLGNVQPSPAPSAAVTTSPTRWSSGASPSRSVGVANMSTGSDRSRQRIAVGHFIDSTFSLPLVAQLPERDVAAVMNIRRMYPSPMNGNRRCTNISDNSKITENENIRNTDDPETVIWSRLPTLVACLVDVLRTEGGFSDEWLLNECAHAICPNTPVAREEEYTVERRQGVVCMPRAQLASETTRRVPVEDGGFVREIRLPDNPLDRLQLMMYIKVLVVMFLFDSPKELYAVVFLFLALHVHGVLDPLIHAALSFNADVRPRRTLDQTLTELRDRQGANADPITSEELPPAAESSSAPATESSSAPATESSSAPATESSSAPATESSSAPATESSSAPATESSSAPAKESSSAPAAESSS
eukprot:Lankesteria_metandrocarpae@DN4219_c0_g1_i4.p1